METTDPALVLRARFYRGMTRNCRSVGLGDPQQVDIAFDALLPFLFAQARNAVASQDRAELMRLAWFLNIVNGHADQDRLDG